MTKLDELEALARAAEPSIIRVEDGHGKLHGFVWGNTQGFGTYWNSENWLTLEWTQRVKHTTNTFSDVKKVMRVRVGWVIPHGWYIRLKWKERERLRRSGLVSRAREVMGDG